VTKKPLQQVEVFKYAESRGFTDADGHVAIVEAIGSAMSYPIVRPGCNRELKTLYFDKAISYDTVYLTDYAPMLAWYPFAKNGADSSGNLFDLEMNGGSFVHDRYGLKERAIELDGVQDFLRLSHKPELNIGVEDDLTICFWVKCSGTRPAHESILHKSEGTGDDLVGYEVGLNSVGGGDAAPELTMGSTLGVQRVYDPFKADYSSGAWHLLTVRIDRKERLIDFWNIGQDAEAQVLGGNMDNNGDLIIGKGSDGTFFKGTLDEIMIFKGYLTLEDLRYLEAKK
jgi:hypothetical protein